ncbi:hypothetical protein QTP70_014959, partial [Hemibagrus guttatus]
MLIQGHKLMAQGRGHPGWGVNPLQGMITHTQSTDNLEMPISLQHMALDWGRKPPKHEENMLGWMKESTNPD